MDSKTQLEIVGLIKESNFHVAKNIAEVKRWFLQFYFRCVWYFYLDILKKTFVFANQGLKQKFPEAFSDPKIQPLLEFDWHTYLFNKKRVSLMPFVQSPINNWNGNPNPHYSFVHSKEN